MRSLLTILASWTALTVGLAAAHADDTVLAPQPEREWTFLVYLNGHNSLDSFGIANIRDMEKVGSTDKVNVVVQWASYKNPKTKRLFVMKQTGSATGPLASRVVEELPTVDMGDWHSLVEFAKWGAKTFPAKHYFVDVWDHGGGWHLSPEALASGDVQATDISWDDRTGHVIKTEQLGQAMGEIAAAIGHKVDIYGSDACLMAMAEVAGEMAGSVDAFVGSQEVEPGAGWPYDGFLNAWNALNDASPQNVAKALAHAYVQSYMGGSNGTADATMSVFDMSKLADLQAAVKNFGGALAQLSAGSLSKALRVARTAQSFEYNDFVDLVDFASSLSADSEFRAMAEIADVKAAAAAFTTFNEATSSFHGANGLSIWLPTDSYTRKQYAARYAGLAFDKATGWSKFLSALVP